MPFRAVKTTFFHLKSKYKKNTSVIFGYNGFYFFKGDISSMICDDLDTLKVLLGKRIQELRMEKGLSIRKFALIAEVEDAQLINIEKGRVDVKLQTLQKFSMAFGVEVGELFDFRHLK
ncbi:helix-turn-helix domain-containing protein [Pedobacter nutrimenti]|uniref:DNA-binding XRE family transcriptional regulator n=1 Tax=Pedobacter nutrimenti TaxID=1241337 RepID=A0A318U6J4_9SPHI|nr:helix-turn-helix transcriptional regulator [Pedobacter nutrimenti]PYF68470.1 DNA-binding XRE family transcriptional regulator [Pedobacter nutrimenti]